VSKKVPGCSTWEVVSGMVTKRRGSFVIFCQTPVWLRKCHQLLWALSKKYFVLDMREKWPPPLFPPSILIWLCSDTVLSLTEDLLTILSGSLFAMNPPHPSILSSIHLPPVQFPRPYRVCSLGTLLLPKMCHKKGQTEVAALWSHSSARQWVCRAGHECSAKNYFLVHNKWKQKKEPTGLMRKIA
jgi:hypothetical protein